MAGTIKVADQFRTNKLSLQPGGSTVVVVLTDGSRREYDKIKDPYKYCLMIERRGADIHEVFVDGASFNWREV